MILSTFLDVENDRGVDEELLPDEEQEYTDAEKQRAIENKAADDAEQDNNEEEIENGERNQFENSIRKFQSKLTTFEFQSKMKQPRPLM